MKNFCPHLVGYVEGLGLDPAHTTQQDLLDLGVHYERLPRTRSGKFIPIDEISPEDIDPQWRDLIDKTPH